MSHRVSVIVTGFPAQLRNPEPLPGETKIQLAIRNNRGRWGICVENITSKTPMSEEMKACLLDGNMDPIANNAAAQAEVERFVNVCLPTSGRTLQGLARLREHTQSLRGVAEIIEIIWPRERNPSGDAHIAKFSEPLGITVIWIPTGAPNTLDLGSLLHGIHGEFVWLVPGGTRLPITDAVERLDRVIGCLAASPKRAVYSDNIASCVLRVSALHELVRRGQPLPPDQGDLGRLLRQAGYELVGDDDPDLALCELEGEFGGWSGSRGGRHARESGRGRSWWQRLFGG